MYQIQELTKKYGKQLVLSNLNLKFEKGQFVALMGKNGSGKSTLLRLLAQQEVFNSGDILYDGKSLKNPKHDFADKVLFISEEHELPLEEPLSDWADFFESDSERFDSLIFSSLVAKFDLDMNKLFSTLSRGQKMKALFALKAACKPEIYLIDEITSVLDSASRLALMEFLSSERKRGCLIVISTNIASEMQNFATDVCFLKDMKSILYCSTGEISTHFTKLRTSESGLKLEKAGARKVHINSDGSWSFIISNELIRNLVAEETIADKRGITIEDVASYFSSDKV